MVELQDRGTGRLRLPVHPRAPLLARSYVQQVGHGWPGEVVEDAVLAVSELVSNAVRYAASSIDLAITDAQGTIRVEVHDDGDPVVRSRLGNGELQPAESDDEHGRGLFIVAALAARWGITEGAPAPGKAVWFELDLTGLS